MYEVPGIFCNSGLEHCEKKAKMEKCENELRAEIAKNFQEMVANKCPSLCKMKTYPKFSSSDHWPSQLARAVVVKEIRKHFDKLNKLGITSTLDEVVEANFAENGTVDWMRDNFLRLNIYADSVRGNRVSESEAYSFVNFLSEVGGMMGLWLGASMLTFCEPMEIIVNILYFAFTRKARLTSEAPDESAGGDGEPVSDETEVHTSSGSKSTSSKCPSKTDKKDGIGDLRAVVSQPILSIAAQLPPPMRIFEDTDYLRNANERLGPQSGLFTLRKQYDTSAESLESESSGRYKRLSASGSGVEPTGMELHPPKKASVRVKSSTVQITKYRMPIRVFRTVRRYRSERPTRDWVRRSTSLTRSPNTRKCTRTARPARARKRAAIAGWARDPDPGHGCRF